jgi:hypothetical protein
MPTWLVIVIVVLVVLIVLLAIGGYVAVRRRQAASTEQFATSLDEANRKLAAAHAEDKGWEPGALRGAATRLFAEQQPGASVRDMQLVHVEDRPGIEEDKAVFRFETEDGGVNHLILGRSGDGWVLDKLT